jgi:large subunit ribosomal protein L13
MNFSDNTRSQIVDAKGLILGRMASIVAKRLLKGEKIIILNAEEAVISGKRSSIIREAKKFLQVGHFRKGPLHRRRPDTIVKRTIKGMLPRRKSQGIDAFKRLKVYIGTPEKFGRLDTNKILEADSAHLNGSYIKISELSKNIGWIQEKKE